MFYRIPKHFHVLLSIPNVFFKSLDPAGKLDNMKSVTNEIKIMMGLPDAPAPDSIPPPGTFGIKDVGGHHLEKFDGFVHLYRMWKMYFRLPGKYHGKKVITAKITH